MDKIQYVIHTTKIVTSIHKCNYYFKKPLCKMGQKYIYIKHKYDYNIFLSL